MANNMYDLERQSCPSARLRVVEFLLPLPSPTSCSADRKRLDDNVGLVTEQLTSL